MKQNNTVNITAGALWRIAEDDDRSCRRLFVISEESQRIWIQNAAAQLRNSE
jgi:hypothetical protein